MNDGGRKAAMGIERRLRDRGEPTGTWITWDGATRRHQSIFYDGYEHRTSCGLVLDDPPWDVVMDAVELGEDDRVCMSCLKAGRARADG